MKRWLPGLVSVVFVVAVFPGDKPLSATWSSLIQGGGGTKHKTDSVKRVDSGLLYAPLSAREPDSFVVPADPFGLPPEPSNSAPRFSGPVVPDAAPPPRIWRSTGRVGERAAVLTAADGRILVVSGGSRVDSATVISIGNDGVVLEDRAGRFNLRIP